MEYRPLTATYGRYRLIGLILGDCAIMAALLRLRDPSAEAASASQARRGSRRTQPRLRAQHGRRGRLCVELAEQDHPDPRARARSVRGKWTSRWRVTRTSNAYVFSDPKPQLAGVSACESENSPGTRNQDVLDLRWAPASDPNSPLERALRQLGAGIEERLLLNGSGGQVGAQ
jgi:hypothetical protein